MQGRNSPCSIGGQPLLCSRISQRDPARPQRRCGSRFGCIIVGDQEAKMGIQG
jgi:hypothetical protein